MQRALGSEGLWEGCTAITLIVVVDVIAKQPTRTLLHERREGERRVIEKDRVKKRKRRDEER